MYEKWSKGMKNFDKYIAKMEEGDESHPVPTDGLRWGKAESGHGFLHKHKPPKQQMQDVADGASQHQVVGRWGGWQSFHRPWSQAGDRMNG